MSLPAPYYSHAGIVIYNCDCRDILPHLQKVDLTLTDPPYNCGKPYGTHDDLMESGEYRSWLSGILGACADLSRNVVYFPGTRNVLDAASVLRPAGLNPVHVLGWHKKEYAGDKWKSGPAQCWEPVIWASRDIRPDFNTLFGWKGRDFLVVNSTHGHGIDHPCPKPLEVLQWLVRLFAPASGIVLDPLAGTCTTGVAAKQLGHKAILIEIEERYCEIGAKRLSQEMLPLEPATPQTEEQMMLLGWQDELKEEALED